MKKRKVRKRKGTKRYGAAFTQEDRLNVLLEVDEVLRDPEGAELTDPLFFEFYDGSDDLPPVGDPAFMAQLDQESAHAFNFWACFDAEPGSGGRLVDVMLSNRQRPKGQRAFLEAARRSRMKLYEVVGVEPGASMTLREALTDGPVVKVRELSASRTITRGTLVATRVFARGASGEPEMDGGFFSYGEGQRPYVLSEAEAELRDFREHEPEGSMDAFWRDMPPVLHDEWRTPSFPRMINYDGDPMVLTTVRFDLRDEAALRAALDTEEALEAGDKDRWAWSGVGADREERVTLGWIALDAGTAKVTLETNSVERGERGRAMLEGLAPEAVAYRAAVHRDPQQAVLEDLASGRTREEPEEDAGLQEQLRDLGEQMMAEHHTKWVDEPVPALDDHTPREAAADARLRPALVELLASFDRLYESALGDGRPTADPSWIRDELDVHEGRPLRDPARPPPLAHERMAELLPGLAELSVTIAERVRREPGYTPMRSIERPELLDDLGFQRFVRGHELEEAALHADPETAATAEELVATHLELSSNMELHHRKVFWVGEGLSWMLGATRLDVRGDQLRLPFGSFAVVFEDRYALGLAERMLSREPECRVRGHLLRVVTAYVTETERGVRVAFACDTFDSGWPYLVVRDLSVDDDAPLDAIVDSHFPGTRDEGVPAIFRCTPLRELLRLVFNAVLYATSADAEPGPPSGGGGTTGETPVSGVSDSVFHLPGRIDIGTLRQLKRAVYGSTDRAQVQRCMVRGHWRAASKRYKDQRPRWIAPHWRGPRVAALVERQYRLDPGKARGPAAGAKGD